MSNRKQQLAMSMSVKPSKKYETPEKLSQPNRSTSSKQRSPAKAPLRLTIKLEDIIKTCKNYEEDFAKGQFEASGSAEDVKNKELMKTAPVVLSQSQQKIDEAKNSKACIVQKPEKVRLKNKFTVSSKADLANNNETYMASIEKAIESHFGCKVKVTKESSIASLPKTAIVLYDNALEVYSIFKQY